MNCQNILSSKTRALYIMLGELIRSVLNSITVLWDIRNLTKSSNQLVWIFQSVNKGHFYKLEVSFYLSTICMVHQKCPLWLYLKALVAWRPFSSLFLPEIIVLWLIVAKPCSFVNSSDRTFIELSSDIRIRWKPSQYCTSFSRFWRL